MSREIKFRAWLERKQEMLTPYFFVNDENFITQYGSGKPDSVMQFTGLKDKNGVEIYEGDILRFKGESINSFNFVVSMLKSGCFAVHRYRNEKDFYFLDDFDYLVVGNIQENPELIENT